MARPPIGLGVYCFEENPHRSADDADIFWDACHDPTVIVARAEAARSFDRQAFDLLAQRVPATILRRREQPEELRLGIVDGRAIRLSITSGTLLEGPVRLSYHLSGDRFLGIRLRALSVFDDLMLHGRVPVLKTPAPSPRRMAMVLATMDGLARGWSQRQIAIALFGEDTVAADWTGPSDFLKSRVRRLIAWVGELSGDAYMGILGR